MSAEQAACSAAETGEHCGEYIKLQGWVEKWEKQDIPFHLNMVHPILVKLKDTILGGGDALKMLVPLCGKSLDMKWLADQGHTAVGIEVSRTGVEDFFKEQGVPYSVEDVASVNGQRFKSEDDKLRLYCCNVFDFKSDVEGQFDIIWDVGAFIVLNVEDKRRYVDRMIELLKPKGRYFLEVMEGFEPKTGPPNADPDPEVVALFGSRCHIKKVEEYDWGDFCPDFGSFGAELHLITHK